MAAGFSGAEFLRAGLSGALVTSLEWCNFFFDSIFCKKHRKLYQNLVVSRVEFEHVAVSFARNTKLYEILVSAVSEEATAKT